MGGPVSRETPPPPPEGAAAFFGDHLDVAVRYAELLADAGVTRGLIGPREVDRLWERHLVNCALVAEGFGSGETVCDVGAGAGLPGMVLAIVRPDLTITLLEPLLRRTVFLQETVGALGLTNVEVARGRAEDTRARSFDAVTARAVAPLDRLAGWTLPLCRPGGRLLALKGATAAAELAEHEGALRRHGARSWRVREFSAGGESALAIEVVAGDTKGRSAGSRGTRAGTGGTATATGRAAGGAPRRAPGPAAGTRRRQGRSGRSGSSEV